MSSTARVVAHTDQSSAINTANPETSVLNHHNGPPFSVSPTDSNRSPNRPRIPMRASTTGSTPDSTPASYNLTIPYTRSEDSNHPTFPSSHTGSSTTGSVQDFASSSRPTTPASSDQHHRIDRRQSLGSLSSAGTSASDYMRGAFPASTTSTGSSGASAGPCSACGKPLQGAFVRALGTVFHLSCFSCADCGEVVASKFFPIEGPDGKQHPLCEKHYFCRLNLICAKCDLALRGSYITACNRKYHVEHFTCSVCPTLFGPEDSYYEHNSDVYCHFHYSTRFATKCVGCNSAILKQFVEINRNMRDECWHPECYMINKFWNVKIVTKRPTSGLEGEPPEPEYFEEERRETASSLKEKQASMEQQVYRIWTVLSAFEESSAACISDMLRHVSSVQYLEAIRMAEKFILHVEVLFATIDDLEYHFSRLGLKGMSHVREARLLCRKTVDLFTLLSRTQETGASRMGMTQELLALVTGLAHYLKILIRIALTGALRLEREEGVSGAMTSFLDKLHLLAVQGGNPTTRRLIKGSNGEVLTTTLSGTSNVGTQGVIYGFRSLAPENAGDTPFSPASGSTSRDGLRLPSSSSVPSDLCIRCGLTVEEDCVRLGTYQRWHSNCVQCGVCGKVAALPSAEKKEKAPEEKEKGSEKGEPPKISTARRPPANVALFIYDPESRKDSGTFGEVPTVILCTEHGHQGCRGGFQAVSRLEQYAFLLNVALRRLYLLLKKQGVVPLSPVSPTTTSGQPSRKGASDPYRHSGDTMRMKTVHLDRKTSATARTPQRSTVHESLAGKGIQESGVLHPPRPQDSGSQRPGHVRSPPLQTVPPASRGQGEPSGSVYRPIHARSNAEVSVSEESTMTLTPLEPPPSDPTLEDDGITLADIPQIVEAVQAHEEHRSLPRESSVPYISDLSALELAIVKHTALLTLHRSPLRDQFELDEILDLLEVKKSGFFYKLFKTGNGQRNVKKKGVFNVPLELLVEREGVDSLLGATRSTLRIPSFIDDVISAMRQMDMSVEGIFRKNGNIRRLKDLTEAIDRDPSSVDLTQDNPVQLAALLKKFLRDLPDPLLTFKLHKLLIATLGAPTDSERKRLLHMVSLILPKPHRDTMEVLFVFLKWVASFAHMDEETGSKMDLGNLATVICPSILYARGRDAVRDDSFSAIRVVTMLLEHQDEFFQVPVEFLPILDDQNYFLNSMDLPSKEFMKKCDTYMRLKTNGRPPPMISPSNSGQGGNHARYPQSPPMPDRQTMSPPMPPLATPRQPYQGSPSQYNQPPSTPQLAGDWPTPPRPQPPPGRPLSWTQARPNEDLPCSQPLVQNGERHR